MKPDGTSPLSTADEKLTSPEGTHVTEQDGASGSEVKTCCQPDCTTWSYIFVHHSKVKSVEAQLTRDSRTFFVHKSIRYFRKLGRSRVQHREVPTVSGLVFLQGRPAEIQAYLNQHFIQTYLCHNCSTGRVAVIPDAQMRPFMRINATEPERIRFLLRPFHYYACNRILLRIASGPLAGLEGYVIRIDRDRRLVMDVGGISVAISGVHAEHFEEVEPAATPQAASPFYQRNLHEREALIDRYFHPVQTASDVAVQADNVDYLRQYVLTEQAHHRMDTHQAWRTLTFIIREIAYYYAPFVDQFDEQLAPIFVQGARVMQELDRLLATAPLDAPTHARYEAEHQQLMTQYDYLF